MKTIDEIRLQNLQLLVDQAGGLTQLVEKSNNKLSRPTLYQILSRIKTDKGADKNVGDDLARKIEDSLRLERGWMDNSREAVIAAPDPDRVPSSALIELITLFSESSDYGRGQIIELARRAEKLAVLDNRSASGNES